MSVLRLPDSNRAEWLAWRREGIGASDAAAIAGFSPFDSPTSIYMKKLGLIHSDDEDEQDWQRMGHLLEPVIARLFEEETGYQVTDEQLRATHPERLWQRCTLDGFVEADGERMGPIEIKSTLRWNGEWGAEPPDYYVCQLQHQMAVTGANVGWLAVLIDGRRFRWWEIERDSLSIDLLESVEAAFWRRVVERRPPAVDGSEKTNEALRQAYEKPARPATELDMRGLEAVQELREARDARLAAEKAETAAQNAVLALLKGAEEATWQGKVAVRWSLLERTADDLGALRAAGIEIPKTTTQYRRWWLPKAKEN